MSGGHSLPITSSKKAKKLGNEVLVFHDYENRYEKSVTYTSSKKEKNWGTKYSFSMTMKTDMRRVLLTVVFDPRTAEGWMMLL